MKKMFITCFLLIGFIFYGQVTLADASFEFKRNTDYHQLITQMNPDTHEIFSFAADKEQFIGIKFNSAIFFSDSIVSKKPFNFRFLLGCGFSSDQKPIAYWATEDFEKITGVEFDFISHTTKTILYPISFKNYTIFTQFYENGSLYFITEQKTSKEIQLVKLTGHEILINTLNFTSFTFENASKNKTTLNDLFDLYGLAKIDLNAFNSFLEGANPIKYYVRNDSLIISLNHNPSKTQIYTIDLKSFEIKENNFIANLASVTQSNSLLFDKNIVILSLNEEELDIQILDFETKKNIKKYKIIEDSISPFTANFLVQTENNSPKKIKNSKQFISKLASTRLGASFYKHNNTYYVTFGGTKDVVRNSDILMNIGLEMAGVGGNYGNNYIPQNVFFDVLLDTNFNEKETGYQPLYIDKIARFTSQNRFVNYESYFPYKKFYILSYYDSKTKEIILSKFTNGYDY
ncbi:conserved hypothetical protein [Flavobacterium sp. 9AF]|uniref:hypothetical protein n=1 Tax=Flavobacterium sp. 9AF TaxID=2653142 RepID=UPI0012F1EF7F|nr:hypothetical protein [Flavobacterium sp. 9AF]VXB78897.1 conserved hypothetical protein [Flavobacterium sp. 9AF]